MVKFTVSTRAVREALASLGLSKKHSAEIARGVGAAAFAAWKKFAQTELGSTSRDYIQGLQLAQEGATVTITLNGVLPNLIEQGFEGGDMRQWMLRSPKSKPMKGGGRYLVIPFRHGVPSTKGRNVGRPMPKEIYRAAKALPATTSMVIQPTSGKLSARTQWGRRLMPDQPRVGRNRQGLHDLGLPPTARRQAREKLHELMRPWHTTSIWTGMVRNEAMYKNAKQSSYGTFRTISSNIFRRDPRSWMHPGIKARNFAPRVQNQIVSVLSEVVNTVIRGGGE